MSGNFDSPRTASVAPPGYQGRARSSTPFTRNRAALDRVPQGWGSPTERSGAWSSAGGPSGGWSSANAWGPTVGNTGAAWAPTGATYEPITHGNPADSHFLPSTPRQQTTRTIKRAG